MSGNTGVVRRWAGRFLAAIQFLTRLPTPSWTPHSPADLGASAAFFPAVGALVGGFAAAVVWLLRSPLGFPPPVGAVAGIGVAVVITGFLHEDGFADVCDAFGGPTPEKRREIMRDSRIGAFGATGLAWLVGTELVLLASMPLERVAAALICAHTLGRFSSVLLIRIANRTTSAMSISTPYLDGVGNSVVAVSALTTFGVLSVSTNLIWAFGLGVLAVCVTMLARTTFNRLLGGVSGDCLGAANKVVQMLTLCTAAHPRFAAPFWR